jgi:hypothetical protein
VQGGNVKALASFANRDRVYIFSDNRCYSFNVVLSLTNPFGALQEIFPIGCAGPNAVIVQDGIMYWMDTGGKIWAWTGGTTVPEQISYQIDDDELKDSIVSSINKSVENMEKVAAFGIGKLIYFSTGSLSVRSRQLKNAVIKIFLSQNGLRGFTSIDTYPDRILNGAQFKIQGQDEMVCGNSSNILQMRTGLNDVTTNNTAVAVNALYQTKSYNFGYPLTTKRLGDLMITYKPQSDNSELGISVYVDNSIDPNIVTASGKQDKYGKFNMKEGKSTDRRITKMVNMSQEVEGDTIMFEFSNNQLNQSFELHQFGAYELEIKNLNISIE